MLPTGVKTKNGSTITHDNSTITGNCMMFA
jgi:hypothetical protein